MEEGMDDDEGSEVDFPILPLLDAFMEEGMDDDEGSEVDFPILPLLNAFMEEALVTPAATTSSSRWGWAGAFSNVSVLLSL
jgi:hypothetical protein